MVYPSSEEVDVLGATSASGPSAEKGFASYLERVAPEIDATIAQLLLRLPRGESVDEDITRMLLGGKRLRGALVLLAFDTLSDDQERRKTALDLAAVVELTHSISLILDDIIDEDVVRRGESALHVNNGEKLAFLKMVDCIALPYRIAAGYGGDLVEQLATTHRQMVRGVREEATRSVNPTPERYERIISLKTGALFGLAARYGAFAADADSDVLEAMSEFGMWTGRAMQIADDVADLRLALEGGSTRVLGSELVLLQMLDEGQRRTSLPHQFSIGDGTTNATGIADAYYDLIRKRMLNRLNEELSKTASAGTALRGKIQGRCPAESGSHLDVLIDAPFQIARIVLDSVARR